MESPEEPPSLFRWAVLGQAGPLVSPRAWPPARVTVDRAAWAAEGRVPPSLEGRSLTRLWL